MLAGRVSWLPCWMIRIVSVLYLSLCRTVLSSSRLKILSVWFQGDWAGKVWIVGPRLVFEDLR